MHKTYFIFNLSKLFKKLQFNILKKLNNNCNVFKLLHNLKCTNFYTINLNIKPKLLQDMFSLLK